MKVRVYSDPKQEKKEIREVIERGLGPQKDINYGKIATLTLAIIIVIFILLLYLPTIANNNSNRFEPTIRCKLNDHIACTGIRIDEQGFQIQITNENPGNIVITQISIGQCDTNQSSFIEANSNAWINADCMSDGYLNQPVVVYYVNKLSGLSHIVHGTINHQYDYYFYEILD